MQQPAAGDAGITILQAGGEHLDLVAPLFDAYRQFYRQPPDLAAARAYLAERLARGESRVLLALFGAGADASPAGFVQLYPSFSSLSLRPVWILYDLFVAPEARRRGVARALLGHARALAAAAGAAELTLETAVDNHAAQTLYESLGWRRDDEYLTYILSL